MDCKGAKPCGCRDCGPFLINGKGEFRSLAGEPMAREVSGRRRLARRSKLAEYVRGSHRGVPARPRRVAGPRFGTGAAGLPPTPALPEGARLARDSASGRPGLPLGSGGSGIAGRRDERPGVSIGALPAISPGPAVRFSDFERPLAEGLEPFGMLPVGAAEMPGGAAAMDLGWDAAQPAWEDLPLLDVHPVRQFVPPPPAPQRVALVNGFDSAWGPPPDNYKGVKLRFDPRIGGYAFDYRSPTVRQAFLASGRPDLMDWYADVAHRYAMGLMLQPFRDDRAGTSDSWQFRWVPRRQEVNYGPVA